MRTRKILGYCLLTAVLAVGVALAAQTYDIGQKGKVFSQASITVKVGEGVRFINDDVVTHNVFATGEKFSFNLRKQAPGAATVVHFPREGKYECRCAIHPNMKLEVTVVK